MTAVATFRTLSLASQIRELKREQKMRAHVYPMLIAKGKLRQKDADYQDACLDSAIKTLERLDIVAAGLGRG